jgi:hypothetical protein
MVLGVQSSRPHENSVHLPKVLYSSVVLLIFGSIIASDDPFSGYFNEVMK